jgi:hypothetical protein
VYFVLKVFCPIAEYVCIIRIGKAYIKLFVAMLSFNNMHEFVFASADFLQNPMLSTTRGGCVHGASLLNDDLHEMIHMVLEIIRLVSEKRHRGDSNPCGQSLMDFESISLTARTQCL